VRRSLMLTLMTWSLLSIPGSAFAAEGGTGGWVGPFAQRVREADRSRFYARLAAATAALVAADLPLVGALREAVP